MNYILVIATCASHVLYSYKLIPTVYRETLTEAKFDEFDEFGSNRQIRTTQN